VALPNQPIDVRGNIFVPYAGQIPATGKTPAQVDQEIVDRIKNRAIEPQAVVALVTQNSSFITVIGEVNGSTAFSPSGRIVPRPSGERLLDVITHLGSARAPWTPGRGSIWIADLQTRQQYLGVA
jgi:polysaccharide export outer membrane protein